MSKEAGAQAWRTALDPEPDQVVSLLRERQRRQVARHDKATRRQRGGPPLAQATTEQVEARLAAIRRWLAAA